MTNKSRGKLSDLMNILDPKNITNLIEGKQVELCNEEVPRKSRDDSDEKPGRISYDQREGSKHKKNKRHNRDDDRRDRDRKREDYNDRRRSRERDGDNTRRRHDSRDDPSDDDYRSKRRRCDEDRHSKRDDRRERRRSRSPRGNFRYDDYKHRSDKRELPLEPVVGEIYNGRVSNIVKFGCFVHIYGLARQCDGLVHISEMGIARGREVGEVFTKGQEVKVKVLSVIDKIKLTLKGIDQDTGEDLNPKGAESKESNFRNPDKPSNHDMHNAGFIQPAKSFKTTRSATERWELKQMAAAGIHLNFNEDEDDYEDGDFNEEIIDIEMSEHRPIFLKNWSDDATDMDPITVFQNPDGSMAKAAQVQTALHKERVDIKREQERERGNGYASDLNRNWEDPMALKQPTLPSTNTRQVEMPDWKKSITGGSYGKKDKRSILEQRQSLPVFKLKDELLQKIAENQVLIVIGETGSGKSTQITQYLAEAGYSQRGKIACTQPRRVAAISVAKRVAEEFGCILGKDVGYAIRFEDRTDQTTVIKYMTDGILLKECLTDPYLKEYSVIMLDEAHERTVGTDVLLGLLKQAIKQRPDLKLIVTSATLDSAKFQAFFGAPFMKLDGKPHEVSTFYVEDPERDYLQAVITTVILIHIENNLDGDILVFLTGQEEIDTTCEQLYNYSKTLRQDNLIILPIYSALPSEMQSRVFEPTPPGYRKVVIATNIAETSLTIDGIVYVIDPGFVKQKFYNPKTEVDQLEIAPISKAQAIQRAGRAGRTRPGYCYRLYTEKAFRTEMRDTCLPEMLRTDLTNTVLTMKAMGINEILEFDFMDRPSTVGLQLALKNLYDLGALDDQGLLSTVGRRMAEFPLEPRLAKTLIMSTKLGCSEEILTIVSMISVENVFYRPRGKETQADQKKGKFNRPEGDHLTLLTVYNAWVKNGHSKPWCSENFIQQRTLEHANDIRKQLHSLMIKHNLPLVSCGKNANLVQKAILSGFFQNVAKMDGKEGFKRLKDFQDVFIHPSSSLFQNQPRYVIYNELQLTTREYMREVMAIDPKWLIELSPNTFKHSDPLVLSKSKKNEKIEPLFNPHQQEWRVSRMFKKTFTKTTF